MHREQSARSCRAGAFPEPGAAQVVANWHQVRDPGLGRLHLGGGGQLTAVPACIRLGQEQVWAVTAVPGVGTEASGLATGAAGPHKGARSQVAHEGGLRAEAIAACGQGGSFRLGCQSENPRILGFRREWARPAGEFAGASARDRGTALRPRLPGPTAAFPGRCKAGCWRPPGARAREARGGLVLRDAPGIPHRQQDALRDAADRSTGCSESGTEPVIRSGLPGEDPNHNRSLSLSQLSGFELPSNLRDLRKRRNSVWRE